MGCQVYWLRDRQAVCIRFYDQVTIEDVAQANREGVALNNQTPNGVPMVIDASGVKSFPVNLAKLRGSIQNVDTARSGYFILIVGENSLFRFIGSVLMQVFGGKDGFAIVPTLEAALETLNRRFPFAEPLTQPEEQINDHPEG